MTPRAKAMGAVAAAVILCGGIIAIAARGGQAAPKFTRIEYVKKDQSRVRETDGRAPRFEAERE